MSRRRGVDAKGIHAASSQQLSVTFIAWLRWDDTRLPFRCRMFRLGQSHWLRAASPIGSAAGISAQHLFFLRKRQMVGFQGTMVSR